MKEILNCWYPIVNREGQRKEDTNRKRKQIKGKKKIQLENRRLLI